MLEGLFLVDFRFLCESLRRFRAWLRVSFLRLPVFLVFDGKWFRFKLEAPFRLRHARRNLPRALSPHPGFEFVMSAIVFPWPR